MPDFYYVVLAGLGGVAAPFILLWLRSRALKRPVRATRPLTAAERQALRRRHHLSLIAFVAFWAASLSLMLLVTLRPASPALQTAVLVAILSLLLANVALQLTHRCPLCGYRLGYQNALGLPPRCERCGANLS
jgi:quinol-cytochrome oxidoreductase complex cytochrome b subunit